MLLDLGIAESLDRRDKVVNAIPGQITNERPEQRIRNELTGVKPCDPERIKKKDNQLCWRTQTPRSRKC